MTGRVVLGLGREELMDVCLANLFYHKDSFPKHRFICFERLMEMIPCVGDLIRRLPSSPDSSAWGSASSTPPLFRPFHFSLVASLCPIGRIEHADAGN